MDEWVITAVVQVDGKVWVTSLVQELLHAMDADKRRKEERMKEEEKRREEKRQASSRTD